GKLKGKKVTLTWAYHPKALPMAVGNSFAAIASQLGADLTIAHPPEFALEKKFLDSLPRAPRIVHSKQEGLDGAQCVYAKSWGGSSYYGKWEEEKKVREGLKSWICDSVPKGALVMLHGGGKQASQLSKQLGIEPQMVQGRRITDEKTLDVVMMVFAGQINTEIIAALREYGAEPVGISGVDGGIINAVKRPPQKIK